MTAAELKPHPPEEIQDELFNQPPQPWHRCKNLHIVVRDGEIEINGEEFIDLSRGADISIHLYWDGRTQTKKISIIVKPDTNTTSTEKVLTGIGMVLGKRFIDEGD